MSTDEDQVALARVGQTVAGRYTLTHLLGTGGMAAVYRAVTSDGAPVAVKVLHPEMARRADVRERFVREAYVANKVNHPGAVAVLEHGVDDEAFLVMELLEGEPLASRVKGAGLTQDELLDVLDQILDVLAVAHDAGIIHRDIKPDNLFLCNDGRVEVLDFGLARMTDELPGAFKTRTGLALGTLPYMPPEQALGRRDQLDGRADLFSLGASAFRILAGRRVHQAPSEAELLMAMATQPAPPLASVAPNVHPHLCAIIDLSLAFSKDARYPDARTMQADVRAVREGRPPPYAVGLGVQTSRMEETRVDRSAPVVSPAAVVAAGPPSTRWDASTLEAPPPSAAQPHSLRGDMAPVSLPGSAWAPSAGSTAPPPRSSGLVLGLLLGGVFLLLLLGVAGAAVLYGLSDRSADSTQDSSPAPLEPMTGTAGELASDEGGTTAAPDEAPLRPEPAVAPTSQGPVTTTTRKVTAPTPTATKGKGNKGNKGKPR